LWNSSIFESSCHILAAECMISFDLEVKLNVDPAIGPHHCVIDFDE